MVEVSARRLQRLHVGREVEMSVWDSTSRNYSGIEEEDPGGIPPAGVIMGARAQPPVPTQYSGP